MIFTSNFFSGPIFFRFRFFLLIIEAFQNPIFFFVTESKNSDYVTNTDTDGTLAEFEKFRTEYWIYVLDKLSVIKTKYKQMKRNISRWYPAFFLWVTVPFSISALQKVFPAQEQINKTQKNETNRKDIETKTTPLQCTRNEFNTIRKSLAYLPFSAFKIVFAFFFYFVLLGICLFFHKNSRSFWNCFNFSP